MVHYLAVGLVVVYHQRPETGKVDSRGGDPSSMRVYAERNLEEEGGAHAGLAVDPYLSAHKLNQLLADGQPQPRAPVAAGG